MSYIRHLKSSKIIYAIVVLLLLTVTVLLFCVNRHSVKFFVDNQLVLETKTNIAGSINKKSIETINNIIYKDGYEFIGWEYEKNKDLLMNNDDVGKHKFKENMQLSAVYKIKSFEVKFIGKDENIIHTYNVNYGQYPEEPENIPEIEGYTFIGWDKPLEKVECDTEYNAIYKLNEYKIEFIGKDGDIINTCNVNYGQYPEEPENIPEIEGYTFIGWDKPLEKVKNNIDYTAIYEVNEYTIIFKNWDNSIISYKKYKYGDKLVLPSSPVRQSDSNYTYKFIGWSENISSKVTSDKEYKAVFELVKILRCSICNGIGHLDSNCPNICEYCKEYGHSIKECMQKTFDRGAIGRWVMPDLGIDVACFDSWDQSVTDAKDSANYFQYGNQTVICDHQNQGFNSIKKSVVGTHGYLKTYNGTLKYECTKVMQGHNNGSLTDLDYNDIIDMNSGGITLYTCNETWQNITIVFMQPS